MKNILNLMVAGVVILTASTSIAATKTDTQTNWICTTNASSSSLDAEKAADAKMAKNAASTTDAFSFAAANCRDCTKITCEVQN